MPELGVQLLPLGDLAPQCLIGLPKPPVPPHHARRLPADRTEQQGHQLQEPGLLPDRRYHGETRPGRRGIFVEIPIPGLDLEEMGAAGQGEKDLARLGRKGRPRPAVQTPGVAQFRFRGVSPGISTLPCQQRVARLRNLVQEQGDLRLRRISIRLIADDHTRLIDPQRPVPRLPKPAPHTVRPQRGRNGMGDPRAAVEATVSLERGRPEAAVGRLPDGSHLVVRQPFLYSVPGPGLPIETHGPISPGTDPEIPVGSHAHIVHPGGECFRFGY